MTEDDLSAATRYKQRADGGGEAENPRFGSETTRKGHGTMSIYAISETERCALLAEMYRNDTRSGWVEFNRGWESACVAIAAAIRALPAKDEGVNMEQLTMERCAKAMCCGCNENVERDGAYHLHRYENGNVHRQPCGALPIHNLLTSRFARHDPHPH